MEFLTDDTLFLKKISEVESVVKRDVQLPKQVFCKDFSKFVVIDFDEIFIDFFHKINAFLLASSEFQWTFAVIDPNPQTYFYYHFKKYPVFEVTIEDDIENYKSLIWEDPGDSPADSLDTNAAVIVVYSKTLNWAIYADKEFEIGIVGFRETETMEKFISSYGKDRIFSMAEAIPNLLEVMYKDKTVPNEIRTELLKNYG